MKFIVSMKDPDTLHDSIEDAVRDELAKSGLTSEERALLFDHRVSKVGSLCAQWFEYGEYLRVEIDTDEETCTVLPVSR